jgi:CRP-like cAMP-binding protein
MKELFSLLNNIHPLSALLKHYLSENLKSRTISKKELLLAAGDTSRQIYFIRRGLLRCYYMEKGEDICSMFIKEEDIFVSASSFFLQKKSHESVQAIEDSHTWYLGYEELQHIFKHFPESNIIARVLFIRSYLLSERRLHLIRMKQASERYKNMLELSPELVLRVPAKYLASYLGVSAGTLSRIRGKK